MSRTTSIASSTHSTNICDIQIFVIYMFVEVKLGQKGEEAFIIIAYKWYTCMINLGRSGLR